MVASSANRLSRDHLQHGLIVSVQAPEGSAMRHPDVIAAMAEASLRNGAIGVRLESPEHIGAVRERCPDALIVGLWKRSFPDSSVYERVGRQFATEGRAGCGEGAASRSHEVRSSPSVAASRHTRPPPAAVQNRGEEE